MYLDSEVNERKRKGKKIWILVDEGRSAFAQGQLLPYSH